MPFWRRPFFELKVLAVWLFLVWERIGIARDIGTGVQDNNFTMTGAKSVGDDINIAELIDICLAENQRRMSPYDRRLLRPFAVPALAAVGAPLHAVSAKTSRVRSRHRMKSASSSSQLWDSLSPLSCDVCRFGRRIRRCRRRRLGWFAILCLYSLALFLLLGAAWHVLVPDTSLAELKVFIWARMVRDAAAEVLPFSQLGGIVLGARAAILHGVSPPLAFASMIVDVTTEMLAQIAYVALGM